MVLAEQDHQGRNLAALLARSNSGCGSAPSAKVIAAVSVIVATLSELGVMTSGRPRADR